MKTFEKMVVIFVDLLGTKNNKKFDDKSTYVSWKRMRKIFFKFVLFFRNDPKFATRGRRNPPFYYVVITLLKLPIAKMG